MARLMHIPLGCFKINFLLFYFVPNTGEGNGLLNVQSTLYYNLSFETMSVDIKVLDVYRYSYSKAKRKS